MDIIAPKKDLLRIVARCAAVADKKSAMPVLGNVLLDADGDRLRVSATDLYLGISGETAVDVKAPGAVALPAKDLLDRIKAMPDGPVHVTVAENSAATLKASGSPRRYTLPGVPGSEFPKLPVAAANAERFELPADLLALLIARTHFSISTDETRAHVNCALVEWAGGRVRMVSTDGHRLSKMETTVFGYYAPAAMLIPLKAIVELRRLAEEAGNGLVQIRTSGPSAFFDIAGMTFSAKLVDAQFPPYQQVIPASSARQVSVPRAQFADIIRAVSVAADKTGRVDIALSPGLLRVISKHEGSDAADEIAVDYSGDAVAVGFNAKYLLDVLGAVSSDEVLLCLSGELDPAVIRPATQDETQDYLGVIMPMRAS